jgi:hypothetical protein
MAGPIAQPDNNIPADMFILQASRNAVRTTDYGRVPIAETDG